MSESKEQQHTPTPWFVDDTTIYFRVRKDGYDSEPAVAECGPDTDSTAWIDKESDDPKLTRRANAEFIVRAVNSHEALVEALRPFANTPTHHFEQGHAGVASECSVCGPILRAMNALALAEKES